MFDANMRYLPKDFDFFCKFHSAREDTRAYSLGIRRGAIVLCTMLDEGHETPDVKMYLPTGDIILNARDDSITAWAVYEGSADGSGFINDESRDIAMAILKRRI